MVYSLLSRLGTKPTFGLNLWVGFYFLLLLLLMYVKRARMNVPNRNMIVNASFTSMASPPPKFPKETLLRKSSARRETMPTQDSIVVIFYLYLHLRTSVLNLFLLVISIYCFRLNETFTDNVSGYRLFADFSCPDG
ncbi:hypothetical protein D3C77_441240 [compost metagenome]